MNESQFSTVMQAIGHLSQEISSIRRDLKNCVTKEDAKKFATKDDLKTFATKDFVKKEIKKQLSAMTNVMLEALGFSLEDTQDQLDNHEVRLVRFESRQRTRRTS